MLWQQWLAAVSAALAAAAAAALALAAVAAAWLVRLGSAGVALQGLWPSDGDDWTAECSAMRTAPSIPAGIWTPSCMAVREAGETSDPHPWPQLRHSSSMAGGMG